jgi:hypothetical protein
MPEDKNNILSNIRTIEARLKEIDNERERMEDYTNFQLQLLGAVLFTVKKT